MTQTLVVDDAHKYVCLHFSAVNATVEPLSAIVVVARCYGRQHPEVKWHQYYPLNSACEIKEMFIIQLYLIVLNNRDI